MARSRKLIIAAVAVLALAVGGVGIAQAVGGDTEEQATGAGAERAKKAAVEAVGGGEASGVERNDGGDGAWEVEVVRPDGSEVEVRLSADLKQVGTETEDDGAKGESDEGESEKD